MVETYCKKCRVEELGEPGAEILGREQESQLEGYEIDS